MDAIKKRKFRLSKKVIVMLVIFGIILFATLFDIIWKNTYSMTVVSCTPEKPMCSGSEAGETETFEFIINVSRFGKNIPGHNLIAYALVEGESAGGFFENVAKTDENGCATFIYYVYMQYPFTEVKPVTFYIMDESNSIFIEINLDMTFEVEVLPRGVA